MTPEQFKQIRKELFPHATHSQYKDMRLFMPPRHGQTISDKTIKRVLIAMRGASHDKG